MLFRPLEIKDLILIQPTVFEDERGHFFESFNKIAFEQAGIKEAFVQDNQSCSRKGVIRGLHFQLPPYSQGKLVRVIRGAVLDVAVDLRKSSPTYGKHVTVELSDENKLMFWIPEGFAHGFLTLQDQTIFHYKCTNFFHKESEACLQWNDPDLGIEWNAFNPVISKKDKVCGQFSSFRSPF